MSETLTTLWLKFNQASNKKTITSNIQIEVLIAIFILSISVATTAMGINSYRKHYLQLSTQRHLTRCVEELAENIELVYPQWKITQSYTSINSSPLSFLNTEKYTSPVSLEEAVNSCSMEMPSYFAKREVFFLSVRKEMLFGDIPFEQVMFYCYTRIFDHWIYASATKCYVIQEI